MSGLTDDRAHDLLLACRANSRDTRIPHGPYIRELLDGAVPFLWTPQAIEQSDRAMEHDFYAPSLVLRPTDLIEPKQFWMLPLLTDEPSTPPKGLLTPRVVALTVTDCGTGVAMALFVDAKTWDGIWTMPYACGAAAWEYGAPDARDDAAHRAVHVFPYRGLYPGRGPETDEAQRRDLATYLSWAVHCQFWLKTTVARTTSLPLSRGARRRAQRVQTLAHDIRVITLRHAAPSGNAADRAAIAYTCQWMVRGHERHLRSGRIVPVRPHVKGPQGRPLRVPAARVYKVDR